MAFGVAVGISFLLYLAIGAWAGRRIGDVNDYYVAGRNAPTVLITGSLVASFLSVVAFMGEVGFAYDGFALPLLILVALNVSGYVFGVLFFGRYLRRSGVLTVPEFFGERFQSPTIQAVAGGTIVIGIGFYLIAVTQGLGVVLAEILAVNQVVAVAIVWITYTLFTWRGGSPGVLLTDTIMMFLFLVAGVVGMSYLVADLGGPRAAMSRAVAVTEKPDLLSWHGVTGEGAYMGEPAEVIVWAVILGLVWATVVAVSPWQTSRYLMARNENVAIRASVLAMTTIFFLYTFLIIGAALLNVYDPQISPSESAFVWAARNVFPLPLGLLAVTGIMAAGLSSSSTFLSLIGFSAARDVMPVLRRKPAAATAGGAGHSLRLSRIVMLAAGAIVFVASAAAPPAVLAIGYFAATLFAASWGPVAFLSIFSDRITARGAIAGLVTGFSVVFVLEFLAFLTEFSLPFWANPVIIGVLANLAACSVGNRGDTVTEQQRAYRLALFQTPAADLTPPVVAGTRRILAYGTGIAVAAFAVLAFGFYLPYSLATG